MVRGAHIFQGRVTALPGNRRFLSLLSSLWFSALSSLKKNGQEGASFRFALVRACASPDLSFEPLLLGPATTVSPVQQRQPPSRDRAPRSSILPPRSSQTWPPYAALAVTPAAWSASPTENSARPPPRRPGLPVSEKEKEQKTGPEPCVVGGKPAPESASRGERPPPAATVGRTDGRTDGRQPRPQHGRR